MMVRSLILSLLLFLGCFTWYTLYSNREQREQYGADIPLELRKEKTSHQPTAPVRAKKHDRGYIINERQQAISLRPIDNQGRILDLYYLFPGQSIRITRLFNTIKTLLVNGKLLEECIIQGVEKPQPINQQHSETIVIRDDENFAPYLECSE